MPVEGWLAQLDDNAASTVDVDIASFDPDGFPLLDTGQIRDHVAAVSAYLTVEDSIVRRHIIRYSLYGRELDIIQSHLTKTHCAASCPRPPVGCCNNQHWRIYSMSDIMMTRPSTVAMQLADHIQHMQADEDTYHGADKPDAHVSRCRYFRDEGCVLHLFKSPLCMHYLCDGVRDWLATSFGPAGRRFSEAMRVMVDRPLERGADFTSDAVVTSALPLMPR